MNCRFADFRCKEVINICDGCRLGYVGDVECRLPDGQLTALIIPEIGRASCRERV